MVNFSTNTRINKMDNHLSPQLIQLKKNTVYGIRNTGPDLGQTHKKGVVAKQVIWINRFIVHHVHILDTNI